MGGEQLNSIWKKAVAFIFLSLFASGMSGGVSAGSSKVRVVSEHEMAFSCPPVLSDVAMMLFPNANLLMIYMADTPDAAAIGEQMDA